MTLTMALSAGECNNSLIAPDRSEHPRFLREQRKAFTMEQTTLFDRPDREGAASGARPANEPLASRMRPETLEDFVGQEHLLGEGKLLRALIEGDSITSMVLWGPPGVGKTTLARIIARRTSMRFVIFSAVTSGIGEIREVMRAAEECRRRGVRTILFVDEIHRFNKAQQDAFLPYVEKGSIILIGATTENPSFELNGALLSRLRVFVLNPLSADELVRVLTRALETDRVLSGVRIDVSDETLHIIADYSKGDARAALNMLETAVSSGDVVDWGIRIDADVLMRVLDRKSLIYDKSGEEHFQVISALHESMRNSDVDATLFWLARMLEAGEDPVWVARRIAVSAATDVGLADTNALSVAMDALQAARVIGMPECAVFLAEAAIYICLAPRSNSVQRAYVMAKRDARVHDDEPIPMAIRAAYTRLQEQLGYGGGYVNPHMTEDKLADMQCMPDALVGREYYFPTDLGDEGRLGARYAEIKRWKIEHRS